MNWLSVISRDILWRRSHLPKPIQVSPLEDGWDLAENKYTFRWFEGDGIPHSFNEIIKFNFVAFVIYILFRRWYAQTNNATIVTLPIDLLHIQVYKTSIMVIISNSLPGD